MAYTFPGPFVPFKHQKETARFIIQNPRCFVFDEMGLGKSAAALWATDFLMSRRQVSRVLIFAPLSTITRVWQDECFKLLMYRNAVVLYGSADKRRKLYADDSWEIGIANFDGVHILAPQIEADIASGRLNMVIVDEAGIFRSTRGSQLKTKMYKRFHSLLKNIERLVLMTGTPTPESPCDAYGLAKMLGATEIPKYFGTWQRTTMYQITQFKWKELPHAYDRVFEILQPAIRHRKDDCSDLPPITYQKRQVALSAAQKASYKDMVNTMRIEFSGDGKDITAAHAADRINKLRQIACGVVKDTETGEYITIDHTPRVKTVLEIISEAEAKVIVVVPFKGIIYELSREMNKHYSTEVINGDVSATKRNDIIDRFRNTPDPRVLLVHPKVMAHGLTLVEANTMIFYAPIYSNDEAEQIIARINRTGQKRSMTVVRLGATTLEWEIYGTVDKKSYNSQKLLEMYKSALDERI